MVPPLNLASTAASSANSSAGFDNSGFVVNYGGAVSGAAVPWWVWAALIAGGVLWMRKR